MSDQFLFDVFLSHSSKDKAVVRPLAERLRADGLRVWFDESQDPAKIEEGLEQSRVLVLCMSGNAFGSDWAQLESGTFRFRDPLNKDRRFIPLRLDAAEVRSALKQFAYVNWREGGNREYDRLLLACQGDAKEPNLYSTDADKAVNILYGHKGQIWGVAAMPDGKRVVSGSADGVLRVWNIDTGECLASIQAHSRGIWRLTVADGQRVVSSSADMTACIWNVDTCIREALYQGHNGSVVQTVMTPDGTLAISASYDGTLRVWDVASGISVEVLTGHSGRVFGVAVLPDGSGFVSCSEDHLLLLWSLKSFDCIGAFIGHRGSVRAVAVSPDGKRLVSASRDKTVRLWDLKSRRCLAILEGHRGRVGSVVFTPDGRQLVSCSFDRTIRVWESESGECLTSLKGHWSDVNAVAVTPDGRFIVSCADDKTVRIWKLPTSQQSVSHAAALRYTNAKVLLVGDTSAGKTGLSARLAKNDWKPSDSTVGAWATHWKLPVSSDDGVEREIWLWDFGGQADQRLIHQLYMEDTALAVLVFDGQKEDLFETLGQWDRDLTRASRKPFTKLLVAGRVDAGGLRVSRNQIDKFVEERGFACFLETSAKANVGCTELKEAILSGIRWADIPWHSSPRLFKRLKEEVLRLKDEGRVLMRLNELRDALRLRLTGGEAQFNDDELKAVIGLLSGPGVVWELAFGSWVLLQPEGINAYAQAVIQTLRSDEHERGAIAEERVLRGDLAYQSSVCRLAADEERFVLLAMHQTLVERGLCMREHTDNGALLIFPSYYRRERPELVGHPAVLVSYYFSGFLDDIYATLVVRLHHTKAFQQDQLWRYAADFKTLTGRQLGVKMTRRAEGMGELEVYFDPAIPMEEKIIFTRYVHEHLLEKGKDVVRLRHYVCPHCGTPVGNLEVAMRRLQGWLEKKATNEVPERAQASSGKGETPTIVCSECEERVPLWDELEQRFASSEMRQRAQELHTQSAIVLDNESKERVLVGEVISTVALAGQVSREFNVSDHGIDMEIEFKNDAGEATGKKLYLQLKSGDSYLRERRTDGAEIFEIKKERHVEYWMAQAFPVMLVIRTSEGEVRWMEVRDWLKRASKNSTKPVKQVIFEGTRFDVMSVRHWRSTALGQKTS